MNLRRNLYNNLKVKKKRLHVNGSGDKSQTKYEESFDDLDGDELSLIQKNSTSDG